MLDEDVQNNTNIVNAMRNWHTNNTPPPGGLGITANPANTVWEIEYGSYGVQFGSIRMNQNNFEVTHVTDAGGVFQAVNYNHVWPGALNAAVVTGALSQNNLNANDAARSVIILMTSEAARSTLVERFVRAILSFNDNANGYATVRALTAEYAHTQNHVGGQVDPGPAWAPLTTQDHLAYATYQKNTLHVVNNFEGINALSAFLNDVGV